MKETGIRVHVVRSADGVQLHLTGERAAHIDAEMLAACANALLACADRNQCLANGLNISSKCLNTLVGHGLESDCLQQGFGLNLLTIKQ